MNNRLKKHVKKHRVVYSCVVTGVIVAGFTAIIMRSSIARGGMREGFNAHGGLTNTASFIFNSPQTVKITNVVDREGRGHPGWPVRNLETKHVSLSQREAANTFGIPEGRLSGHIKGRYPDVDGLHFERVNLIPESSSERR